MTFGNLIQGDYAKMGHCAKMVTNEKATIILLADCFWHIAHFRGGGAGVCIQGLRRCAKPNLGLTSERERKYTTQILHLCPLCPEYQAQVA